MSEHTPLTEDEVKDLRTAHRSSYPMGNMHHGTPERPDWGTFCVECKDSWPCDVALLIEHFTSTATADTAEVLPSAEDFDGCICAYAHDARTPEDNRRLKAGCDLYQQHAATADTGLRERVEALAEVIWDASRADEGTISAAGANHVARAILASGRFVVLAARTTEDEHDCADHAEVDRECASERRRKLQRRYGW